MKRFAVVIAVIAAVVMSAIVAGAAGFPATLSYQGTLTDKAGNSVTGAKTIVFSLYDVATGGTALWTETQEQTITNGRFGAVLGVVNPIDVGIFTGNTWLGITVQGEPEMTPRQKMTSVAYAFNGVPRGVITMWSGSIDSIPQGWALCNGMNGTPDLRDRFVVGAGTSYTPGASGGAAAVNLQHQHSSAHSHDLSNHVHYGTGDGGSLRAAIGAAEGAPHTIAYIADHATSPTTGGSYTATYVSVGTSYQLSRPMSHFTPVFGYTSAPNYNSTGASSAANTGNAGALSQDIRPPYYALAYIMKL